MNADRRMYCRYTFLSPADVPRILGPRIIDNCAGKYTLGGPRSTWPSIFNQRFGHEGGIDLVIQLADDEPLESWESRTASDPPSIALVWWRLSICSFEATIRFGVPRALDPKFHVGHS